MVSAAPDRALVLAAGFGRRLAPLSSVRAKPAVPLAGEPIVRRIVAWLAGHGIRDVVVNLHHLPETIAAVLGDGADLGVRVRYSWEPVLLGAAGGPARALPILGADRFFIVNGDTLADVPLEALADAHEVSGALVTLALTRNPNPDRYGGVILDADGRVTRFTRPGPDARDAYHFVGVQVARAEAFESVPVGRAEDSVGGVYDRLMKERPGSVAGVVFESADFRDIGTVEDYWRTSSEWPGREASASWIGPSSAVDPQARVERSILWEHVVVPRGVRLDCCIVTDGVRLMEGDDYREVILLAGPEGHVRAEPLGFRP